MRDTDYRPVDALEADNNKGNEMTTTDPFYSDEERRFRLLELAVRSSTPSSSADAIVAAAQVFAAFVNDPPTTTPAATA